MPRIGAHVSASVSLELSFDRAQKIGAECTQIFISPPQQWFQTKHSSEEFERYRKNMEKSGINPNFIHGTYLINLGTENREHLQKSINWLTYALHTAEKLGIKGVIFHLGSHKGVGFDTVLEQVTTCLKKVFSNCPGTAFLILENSAGAGGSIGSKFSELGKIIKKVGGGRLKACLDTCHAYAAGYDIKSPIGLKSTFEEFKEEVGIENLVVIHANDAKFDLGSGKDRHENIGEGFIGREGFENIINHPKLKDLPFILEVPGFDGGGPDDENIQTLKSLSQP